MAKDIRVAFGLRLRDLRMTAGMTQEQLADRARLHRNYIGGIERGERNPTLLNIAKLADALGTSPPALFTFQTGMVSSKRGRAHSETPTKK